MNYSETHIFLIYSSFYVNKLKVEKKKSRNKFCHSYLLIHMKTLSTLIDNIVLDLIGFEDIKDLVL